MELTKEQKFYAEVIQKAWEDIEFKQRLIENPKKTLEDFYGGEINIPKGKEIVVRDQTKDTSIIYFDIPAEPNFEELELTDKQLEMVAGGITPSTYVVIFLAAVSLGRYDRDH